MFVAKSKKIEVRDNSEREGTKIEETKTETTEVCFARTLQ